MADFTLDTSGFVAVPLSPGSDNAECVVFGNLSPFAQGYVEALFASAMHESLRDTRSPKTFDQCGFSDLAPETLAAILKDCEAFGQTWRVLEPERGFATGVQGGRDFWWLRNNRELTQPPFPPVAPYLDDTGKVRLREAGG